MNKTEYTIVDIETTGRNAGGSCIKHFKSIIGLTPFKFKQSSNVLVK